MKKFKAIFFDLDGTLLTPNYKVLPEVSQALDDIRDLGLKVSIATGRSYASASNFLDQLKISEAAVFSNGAVYQDPKDMQLTVVGMIGYDIIEPICQRLFQLNKAFRLQDVDGVIYTYQKDKWPANLQYFDSKQLVPSEILKESLKIIILADKPINDLIAELNFPKHILDKINIFNSAHELVEISLKNISKRSAVSKILASWKISFEEIIAVGDQQNDYELIYDAGFGVAIGDGAKTILPISNLVIDPPQKGGILKLAKYLINNV